MYTPVKDSGDCANPWVFAAADAAESQWAITTGIANIKVSTQMLLDCDTVGDATCDGTGGSVESALQLMATYGAFNEWDWQWEEGEDTCYLYERDKTPFKVFPEFFLEYPGYEKIEQNRVAMR